MEVYDTLLQVVLTNNIRIPHHIFLGVQV